MAGMVGCTILPDIETSCFYVDVRRDFINFMYYYSEKGVKETKILLREYSSCCLLHMPTCTLYLINYLCFFAFCFLTNRLLDFVIQSYAGRQRALCLVGNRSTCEKSRLTEGRKNIGIRVYIEVE